MSGAHFAEALREAALHRRLGDAWRKRDNEAEAVKEYEAGLARLEPFRSGPDAAELDAVDLVELHGVRGGLFRRLGRLPDALASYEEGAAVETNAPLPSTYNRLNAVKLALISGRTTLAAAYADLAALENAIDSAVRSDVLTGSDAWTYADLGDVRLLAGRLPEALDAYREFDERARSDSPQTTLTVLDDVVQGLRTHADPGAEKLAADVEQIKDLLRAAGPTPARER
jgi:tetratricopeptide (TPR) repeat protein